MESIEAPLLPKLFTGFQIIGEVSSCLLCPVTELGSLQLSTLYSSAVGEGPVLYYVQFHSLRRLQLFVDDAHFHSWRAPDVDCAQVNSCRSIRLQWIIKPSSRVGEVSSF